MAVRAGMLRRIGRCLWRAGVAAGLGLLAGCGAQELYQPPTAPFVVRGRLALPSQAQDVAVLGDNAFVAGGQAGLEVVDITDPAHPTLIKRLDTVKYAESIQTANVPFGGGVLGIAFVVEGTEGITTYDITDPENAFSFNQGTTAVDGNGLFIEQPADPSEPYIVYLAESWKGVRIFESDPATPGLLRYNGVFADTRGYAIAITVKDGFAYVADDEMGVAVLDVRSRVLGSVVLVSACDTQGNARGIAFYEDHLFVADDADGLVVMEIRQEGSPVVPVPYEIAHVPLPGRCRRIVVRDDTAFLTAQDGGVHFVDVSNPAAPIYLGTVATSYSTGLALASAGLVVVSDRDEGIIVLEGQNPFSDPYPPGAVRDLAAVAIDSTSVLLSWHATGNDGLTGTASLYDVRYALDSIATEADWDAATQAQGEPSPQRSGRAESWEVTGLAPATTYYFALRVGDVAGNRSALSNVVSATTPAGPVLPVLTNPHFSPEGGTADSTFTFEVTYRDANGDAPAAAQVILNGVAHDLTLVSGDYRLGALFRCQLTLPVAAYEHVYSFLDPALGPATTAVIPGPWVGEIYYRMGSPAEEPGRDTDETQHGVALIRRFWISDHEVRQDEYQDIVGSNPSHFVGAALPVENVTWLDAVTYCNARSDSEGLAPAYVITPSGVTWDPAANGYRLPTEAEWEAACRAGTSTAFSGGALTEEACGLDPVLDGLGWYCGNAGASTHPVGSKAANGEGLYDMHGNVWEWCWDWYTADLGTGAAADPSGPATGSQRVIRGGSWYYFARECRSASRAPYWPNSGDDIVGFRVARTLP